ncbi:MAG: PD-(D/E)XK nuclease family protein, partial [Muribaculaceae bacterium]|nr:PD-(D/E)XK nuclease family protein [Muribaculaceae bacterium]
KYPGQTSLDVVENLPYDQYIRRMQEDNAEEYGKQVYDMNGGRFAVTAPQILDSRYDAMLQILAYCEAYADIEENVPIQPILYRFRTMDCEGGILPVTIGGEDISDFHQISSEFRPLLNELISRIFDKNTPFAQAEEGSRTCGYCVFAPMCGRLPDSNEA